MVQAIEAMYGLPRHWSDDSRRREQRKGDFDDRDNTPARRFDKHNLGECPPICRLYFPGPMMRVMTLSLPVLPGYLVDCHI